MHIPAPASRRERGSALVPAILFAITVMAFAMSVITSGLAVNHQRRSLAAAQRAQDASESGIHHLLGALAGPGRYRILSDRKLAGTLTGEEGSDAAQRYEVTLAPAGNDECDNDLDGLIDEEDEKDIYEVTSTGHADRIAKTVRVTLLARYRAPTMPAATYIADPTADLNLAGNAFLISGQDVDLKGAKTGELVPGIGVAGDAGAILSQLRKQQDDNVVGTGGERSVYTVDTIDFNQLIEDAVRSANVRLESGKVEKPAEAGDWGTLETPAILFGSGDIKISGGGGGAGVIVVDGNLTIGGSFEWHGLLIARGEIIFSGGGGTKRVTGGVVVERDVLSGADVTKSAGFGSGDLAINGTVDIRFSKETLAIINKAFATYSILNWREGPNPPGEAAP
ncbi:MAG TPA: hypothetical protein VFY93_03190 [Planctomycetota bacterium]|nr:hypothetical protein [Planctomycetota bacterium]